MFQRKGSFFRRNSKENMLLIKFISLEVLRNRIETITSLVREVLDAHFHFEKVQLEI